MINFTTPMACWKLPAFPERFSPGEEQTTVCQQNRLQPAAAQPAIPGFGFIYNPTNSTATVRLAESCRGNQNMTLREIASALGARLENGSPDTIVTGVAGIEQAGPGQITFLANAKYAAAAKKTRAAAIIVSEEFPAVSTAMLRTRDPYWAFARSIELFYEAPRYPPGVHPTAVIHSSAKIGVNSHIGPYVVIDEGVEIGNQAVLLAHVVIYRAARIGDNFFAHAHAVVREHCRLGDQVTLQNGAVIGGDGFGFAKDNAGHWRKILQSGPAVLEDDVEVQANACV